MFLVSDGIFDLLLGFDDTDGEPEKKVINVISGNLSWKFFLEIFISFAPNILNIYFREERTFIKSWVYGLFKIFRYLRLSEFEGLIDDIKEFHKDSKTEHELQVMNRTLDICNFGVTTLVNLHMLTCGMVMLSHTRDNFEDSWLGGAGVAREDSVACYVTALYFVTTTLSTCGFGDLCPTSGDKFEAFFVLILQFVGMFFYSSTIDRI
jgi:hypothetical protein